MEDFKTVDAGGMRYHIVGCRCQGSMVDMYRSTTRVFLRRGTTYSSVLVGKAMPTRAEVAAAIVAAKNLGGA